MLAYGYASMRNLTVIIIRYSLLIMQAASPNHGFEPTRRRWRSASLALAVTLAVLMLAPLSPGQAQAPQLQARIPTSYANIHDAPSTASNLLLLVPEDTVLPIVGRRGEWVQVRLSPELRQTGMVMRWYEGRHELIRRGERITIGDEDTGWMHDSTVQITEVESP